MLEIRDEYKNIDIIKICTDNYISKNTSKDYKTEYNRIKNYEEISYDIYIVLYKLYEKVIKDKEKLNVKIISKNVLPTIWKYLFNDSIENINIGSGTDRKLETEYKVLIEADKKYEKQLEEYLKEICVEQNIFYINSEEKIKYMI